MTLFDLRMSFHIWCAKRHRRLWKWHVAVMHKLMGGRRG